MLMLRGGATGLVEVNWLTPMKIRKLTMTCSQRYVEVGYLSLRTFINFSDIGAATRKAALEIDENISMSLVGYSWLEEDKSWIVVIESGKVNVVLSSQRYKHLGGYDKAFYINLGITGNDAR
jgi:hypothetical protein